MQPKSSLERTSDLYKSSNVCRSDPQSVFDNTISKFNAFTHSVLSFKI